MMKGTLNRILSRRRFLTLLPASAGAFGAGTSARASGPITTMDYCYWRNEQIAQCFGGTRYEKWCYICNDPGTGWTTYRCEWRPDGSC